MSDLTVAVLDEHTGEPVSLVEDLTEFEWTQRLWRPDTWRMVASPGPTTGALRRGRVVTVQGLDDPALLIGDRARTTDQQLVEVDGPCVGGILDDPGRVVIPPTGDSHDERTGAAETRIKQLVDAHAGPSADQPRRIPLLTVDTDQQRGPTGTTRRRYDPLVEVLEELGQATGVGWRIRRHGSGWRFETVHGVDRSGEIILDLDFESARALRQRESDRDRVTVALVAGQGEGAARTIRTVHDDPEPSGWDRRETFRDARDTDEDDDLDERGRALLETSTEAIETEIDDTSVMAWPAWRLGDIVTVRNAEWDLNVVRRVVAVTHRLEDGQLVRSCELGRTVPRITDQVRGAAASPASSRS